MKIKKTSLEFEPIFLFRDDEHIKRVQEQIKRGANLLNEFIEKTETSLNISLTENEKIEIKDKGINAIENRLKETFLFKQASLEFNLQALGIDIKPISEFYHKNHTLWYSFNYELLNGLFKPLELSEYPHVKALIHYTSSSAQNELLKTAQELCEKFDSLDKKNLVNPHASGEITNITNLLTAKYVNGKVKIVPNLEFIRRYRG